MSEEFLERFLSILENRVAVREDVTLPVFDPDSCDDGAAQWIKDVEVLVDAKTWYEFWRPENKDWATFKQVISDRFAPKCNLSDRFLLAATFNSDSCKSYAEFGREKLAKLERLHFNLPENILVELIVGRITDDIVRQNLLHAKIQTLEDLFISLSGYPKTPKNVKESVHTERRPQKRNSDFHVSKNLKTNHPVHKNVTCFTCGKIGHKSIDCVKRFKNDDSRFKSKFCTFCRKNGHEINNCFTKQNSEKNKESQKINLVQSGQSNNVTTVSIKGKNFSALIDTGADVSLISERALRRINIQTKISFTPLTGFAGETINSLAGSGNNNI